MQGRVDLVLIRVRSRSCFDPERHRPDRGVVVDAGDLVAIPDRHDPHCRPFA
jgi:hypothetical protein